MLIDRTCVVCGAAFMVKESQLRRGRGKCCSLSCAASLASIHRDQSGPSNNNWKGGTTKYSTEKNLERKRRYRRLNPEKHSAHMIVRNALRKGIIVRGVCEICGSSESEGHHDDYSKPLEVRWLCKKHHLQLHGSRFANSKL